MPIISFFMLVFIISFRRKIALMMELHAIVNLCSPDKDFIGPELMAESSERFFPSRRALKALKSLRSEEKWTMEISAKRERLLLAYTWMNLKRGKNR